MQNQSNDKSFVVRVRQFIKFRIIHVDDSPHRIALGVSLGLFTAFLPFLGVHTITALFLAFLTRANKAVAILCSWVSNPLTVIPIFVPCYMLGRAVVGVFTDIPPVDTSQVAEILEKSFSFSGLIAAISSTDFWRELASLFGKIGLELITGSLILGTVVGTISYFASYRMIVSHRKKVSRKHRRTSAIKGDA
jgi:uncharacterized protein (DUF2062 family)